MVQEKRERETGINNHLLMMRNEKAVETIISTGALPVC